MYDLIHKPACFITILVTCLVCGFGGLRAQDDCDTWLQDIYDKKNNCAPYTNGMEKLVAPFGLKRDIDVRISGLNNAIDWQIEDKQEYIDRFEGQTSWLDSMKMVFEDMVKMLDQSRNLKKRNDDLADAIRNVGYDNLGDIVYDCWPSAIKGGRYNPNRPEGLDRLLEDLKALNDDAYYYRSDLANQIAAVLESIISLLSQRENEEQSAKERRDQFADGLSGLIINKLANIRNQKLNLINS